MKTLKQIFCALLCVLLLLAAASPGFAAEKKKPSEEPTEPPAPTLSIGSLERFLTFTEACRLDSYSQGLTVSLETDLDLSGTDFAGIPIFRGIFQGNGHTISGLSLTDDGSAQGLFRYLTEGAEVHDLTVQGQVAPGGSQESIGGIAGSNAGLIQSCIFGGQVSGGSSVGGIVGINTMSGIIEKCGTRGELHGDHFVGGIAGKNQGVIRSCENSALVNTTAQQNTVSLTDVTLETLTGSESAATVTDIGGIAGSSSGVIRSCLNRANVGYQHMGYNIGGIAGTQSGYLTDCENKGSIQGRKETGGIVGQMEPAALIEYDEDALQILKRQLGGMNGIVSKTAANVQNAGSALYGQVSQLQGHVWEAADAVRLLVPDRDDPKLPDPDTIAAARNGLSSSLSGMNQTLESMSASTVSAVGKLSNNLSALQNQLNAMSATLNNVSETLGGSIADVSDADTEDDLTGKVSGCRNFGTVLADLNAGGIAGAIALENDLDPEEDLELQGNRSLNFESQLRAVIVDCENQSAVTAGKRAAGGIAGWQSLGLVKNCRNTGKLDCAGAEYVGGISGQSTGFIRASSANCVLSGSASVGGIAGSAAIVTDCRGMVRLENGKEKLGAILGGTEKDIHDEEAPISQNYYLSVKNDPGGIDGISYDGLAQPLSEEDFFGLEKLPDIFSRALVTFRFDDGTENQIRVATGGALEQSRIPALPEKKGAVGHWEGLEDADLAHIFFDLTFDARYTSLRGVIQSEALSPSGKPLILLQGEFSEDAAFTVTESEDGPTLMDTQTLLGLWDISLPENSRTDSGRLCLPETCDREKLVLQLRSHSLWQEADAKVDGSYLVFPLDEAVDGIALIQIQAFHWQLPAAIAAGAALVLGLVLILVKKRGKTK